jgi:hypothetical protein
LLFAFHNVDHFIHFQLRVSAHFTSRAKPRVFRGERIWGFFSGFKNPEVFLLNVVKECWDEVQWAVNVELKHIRNASPELVVDSALAQLHIVPQAQKVLLNFKRDVVADFAEAQREVHQQVVLRLNLHIQLLSNKRTKCLHLLAVKNVQLHLLLKTLHKVRTVENHHIEYLT